MKKILCLTVPTETYSIAGRAIINGFATRYSSCNFRLVDVYKVNEQIDFCFSEEHTLRQKLAHKLERQRYSKCKDSHSIDKVRKLAEPYLNMIKEYIIHNIKNFEPDIIVCTHIFPAIVLSDLRWENSKLIDKTKIAYIECNYVVSPYIRLAKNLDYYFAASSDTVKEFKKYGIKEEEKIIDFGIPVIEKIENVISKKEARELLNIPDNRFVILVTNGIQNTDNTMALVKAIISKFPDVYILSVCNKNIKLKNKISTYAKDNDIRNLKAFGHTNNLGVMYSACDLVMGKPTGMEVAQAIAKKVPFVSTLKVRGQELDNLKYLKDKSVIINGRTISKAVDSISKIRFDEKTNKKLLIGREKLYRHNATDEIVKFLYHNR